MKSLKQICAIFASVNNIHSHINIIERNIYPKISRAIDGKAYNRVLKYGARLNNKYYFKLAMKHRACNWTDVLLEGCKIGNIDIVKLAIEYGACNWNHAYGRACISGNNEIMDLIKNKVGDASQSFSTYGIIGATLGNNIKIIKFLIREHPHEYLIEEAIYTSCISGNIKLFEYLKKKPNNAEFNQMMTSVCFGNQYDMFKYLISIYPDEIINYGKLLRYVKCNKDPRLFEFVLDKTLQNNQCIKSELESIIGFAFASACKSNLEMIKLIINNDKLKHIRIPWDRGLYSACSKGNIEIIQYIINCSSYYEYCSNSEYNINDKSYTELIISAACLYGDMNITKIIIENRCKRNKVKYQVPLRSVNSGLEDELIYGFRSACTSGNRLMIDYIFTLCKNINNVRLLNAGLEEAKHVGNISVEKLMMRMGAEILTKVSGKSKNGFADSQANSFLDLQTVRQIPLG